MEKLNAGALVIYRTKPALITALDGDKIEIKTASGDSKRVRLKDIEFVHPGNGSISQFPLPMPPEPDLNEAVELMDGETLSFADFTELLFGKYAPAECCAAYQILQDGVYFSGSVSGGVTPKNADAIAASLAQIAEKENARKAREEFLERIKTNALLPEDRIMMRDVEMVALGTAENSKTMRELNIESTPEKAHSLLLKTGVWNELMDPWPSRMEIETGDPESDLPELPDEERVDLTYMTALAIDDADSHDPDDAISFADGLLWVHVADPAAIVTPESELDNEAAQRGANLYLPELISHMLPRKATEIFGLGLAETSPAISFAIRIDEDGTANLEKMVLSTIRVTRYDYLSAEQHWNSPPIAQIRPLLERFKNKRQEDGALFINLPEVKIRLVDDKVQITPIGITPVRELVANAMLAAGSAVARYAVQHDIPMPFTTQPEPDTEERGTSVSSMYALRKACQPGVTSSSPGRHAGLALEPYSRITSPLRRYGDLLAHQQLRRVINGLKPFSAEYIDDRLAASEPAALARRKLERQCNEYWTLVFLQQHPEWSGEAILAARQDDRQTFIIPDLAYEFKNRGTAMELGTTAEIQLIIAEPATMSARFRILP